MTKRAMTINSSMFEGLRLYNFSEVPKVVKRTTHAIGPYFGGGARVATTWQPTTILLSVPTRNYCNMYHIIY